jgi:hypothetical protein
VLVCDNDANQVTRFVLDIEAGCEVLDGEVLLRKRLDIPDSITISPSGDWMAISNHWTNEVFLYRYDARLGPDDEPVGVLEGPNFPHGLRFQPPTGAISRSPIRACHTCTATWRRVATGAVGASRRGRCGSCTTTSSWRGKYNFQEGGPKGLEVIDDASVFVLTKRAPVVGVLRQRRPGWTNPGTDQPISA